MEKFVTLHSFTFPSEIFAIKGRLEAEGIECQTKDELTVQVHNFYSNAIGGIRLQVREKDYEKAKEILIETGYIIEKGQEKDIWSKVDDYTKNIPFLKKTRVELRFILLIGIILSILLFPIFIAMSYSQKKTAPTTYQFITNNKWCLSYIDYNGKKYAPSTITNDEIKIIISGYCDETIDFDTTGRIYIPGFNTKIITGKWKLSNDHLLITELDTLSSVFSNNYRIRKEPNRLILESKNIIIYCDNAFY